MLKLKHLTKTEKKALKEFKEKLLKKLGKEIVLIKLFGSKARGDSTIESDIDVLVVLKEAREKYKDVVYDIVTRLVLKYGLYLSVKVFSQKEYQHFSSIPTVFIKNIAQEGIAV